MSKADAWEVQPDAGLGESEVLAPRTSRRQAAGEVRGAVAGAAGHLLQQPQLGLRGALIDQKASLRCRYSDVPSQASVCVCA